MSLADILKAIEPLGLPRERVYLRGSVCLINDCSLRVLPLLPTGCFHTVVADIPYGEVNRESGGLRNLDKGAADVETFPLLFAVEQSSRLAESAYIWCGTEQVSELRGGFVDRGMTTRLCGWEKSNPSPMNGEYIWLSSFECCVFGRKPKAYFGEHCASPIWRGPIEREQVHPTQKPLWLIQRQVKASCPPDGVTLDFCAGSSTTLIACIRTGRKCVGIERERKYFDASVARLDAEFERTALIEPPPPRIEQAELFGKV